MPHPLRPLLPALAPALDGLIPAAAWQGLERLADRLPAVWSLAGFEVRLAAGEAQTDLGLYALEEDGGRRTLADWLVLGEELPGGGAVRPLLEEWSRSGGALASVPKIWLVYDLPGGIWQAASVGLTFARGEGAAASARLRALAESALRLLPGRHGDGARLDLLERCARRLPPGGRIVHLGVLPPWRESQALRLTALLPSAPALRAWLEAAGRPPDPCLWKAGIELMAHRGALQIGLDLDEEETAPRLALDWPWLVSPSADEIVRLVEHGLCDPDKAQGLRAWAAGPPVYVPAAGWPLRIDRQLGFKVVFRSGREPEAKAYLCFRARHALF